MLTKINPDFKPEKSLFMSPSNRGRILCVTSNFPRWDGDCTTPFVLHLAQDLQEIGWQVDVLAPHAFGCKIVENIGGVYTERFRYFWPEKHQTICYNGGALINLRKNKVNYLKIPFLVTCELAALIKRLKAGNYDLLHSHWILPQGFSGVLSASPLNIPHILTVHGGDIFGLKNKVWTEFKRFTLKRSDAITVNSSSTQKAVEGLIGPSDKIVRIPMGVSVQLLRKADPRVVKIRERYRKSSGFLVTFAGRIVEEKGIGDLINAIALVKNQIPHISAIILGEGQDRSAYEAQVENLGLENQVKFLGWIAPEEIPYYLAAADAFVGPSKPAKNGWIEAQGLTFLEAMAVKTPVIATKQGGILDSVIDGETGFLVDHSKPEQISQKINFIHKNIAIAQTVSEKGYLKVTEQFSRKKSANDFSNLFQTYLGS